jgi:hypothetical protein
MLSRAQQIILKRSQAEAGIGDTEYRSLLSELTGCRSSKDTELSDDHLDMLLSLFEAIHWRGVDTGALQPSCKPNAVFAQRGYWADKNTATQTSRDRYKRRTIAEEIIDLECRLTTRG